MNLLFRSLAKDYKHSFVSFTTRTHDFRQLMLPSRGFSLMNTSHKKKTVTGTVFFLWGE